jgi:hypothetical protein
MKYPGVIIGSNFVLSGSLFDNQALTIKLSMLDYSDLWNNKNIAKPR